MCRSDYILCIVREQVRNYIHGEIIVIGNSEVSQFTQVHVPSSDGVHNEDIRGETQGTACMLGSEA